MSNSELAHCSCFDVRVRDPICLVQSQLSPDLRDPSRRVRATWPRRRDRLRCYARAAVEQRSRRLASATRSSNSTARASLIAPTSSIVDSGREVAGRDRQANGKDLRHRNISCGETTRGRRQCRPFARMVARWRHTGHWKFKPEGLWRRQTLGPEHGQTHRICQTPFPFVVQPSHLLTKRSNPGIDQFHQFCRWIAEREDRRDEDKPPRSRWRTDVCGLCPGRSHSRRRVIAGALCRLQSVRR